MNTIAEGDYTRPAGIATAPDLGLTIIADGLNKPFMLDSQGVKYKCGVGKPIAAPTYVTAPTATAKYIYVYCYAIGNLPKIEHTASAGGLIYPRSNPSPISASMLGPAEASFSMTISLTPSDDPAVTDIFIYRTASFANSTEGEKQVIAAAEAGLLFYVGKTKNAGSAPIIYVDTATAVTSEQVSYDNFLAPMFNQVVYVEPYFYAGGISNLKTTVTVDYTGLLVNTGGKWFEGYSGFVAVLDGVTEGGFDSRGRFYFKYINATSGQLCLDVALTVLAPCPSSGSTTISIDGISNLLYRSAPRNPFSWGETEFIGNAIVPKQTGIRVGGGRIVSIAEVSSSSLLKVDTVEPSRSYTFNLRATSTEDFTLTRKPVNSAVSVDAPKAQVEIPSTEGLQAILGFDAVSGVFFTTDGISTSNISPDISKLLSDMTISDRGSNTHTLYDPYTKTVMFFVRVRSFANFANLYVAYCLHLPTKQWTRFFAPDINCTLRVFDPAKGYYRILVGSSKGRIGSLDDRELGAYNTWWVNTQYSGTDIEAIMPLYSSSLSAGTNVASGISGVGLVLDINDLAPMVGVWAYITTQKDTTNLPATASTYIVRYLARISAVGSLGGGSSYQISFDAIYDLIRDRVLTTFQPLIHVSSPAASIYIGASFLSVSKTVTDTSLSKLGRAVVWKTDAQFSSNSSGGLDVKSNLNRTSFEFWMNEEIAKCPDFQSRVSVSDLVKDESQPQVSSYRFFADDPLPVDILTAFTVSYRSVGYIREQVFRLALKFKNNARNS